MATWDCPYPTGGKRDTRDSRDYVKRYGGSCIPSRPKKVDLRQYIDTVYSQGGLSCCQANALCAAFSLELKRQAKKDGHAYVPFDPSRLFVYYASRLIQNNVADDDGVELRYALRAMNTVGVCKEVEWPYDESKVFVQPVNRAFLTAKGNTICKYKRIDQDIGQFRACLKLGFPIVFHMEIYGSFVEDANAQTGQMPLPSENELQNFKAFLHAVLAVGFDDTEERIIVLNSWGTTFGDGGYFYMPYEYILNPNRCFDFWKIKKVCERGSQPRHNYGATK